VSALSALVPQDEEIAATDALLLDAEAFLEQRLTFHDGDAPEALTADDLADLKSVAEDAQRAAGRQAVGRLGEAVEAADGRTRQHRLPDPFGQALAQTLHVHREEQHRHAGTRVRRLGRRELAFDCRLALAGDHRGRETGELERGFTRPACVAACDDEAHRAHAEGFGKGVLDQYPADSHA
jgi:hypothetical protein